MLWMHLKVNGSAWMKVAIARTLSLKMITEMPLLKQSFSTAFWKRLSPKARK